MDALKYGHGLAHALVKRQGGGETRQGENQGAGPSSASALVSAIVPTLIVAVICFVLFLLFRKKFQRIYQPRTYVSKFKDYEKTPRPSQSLFGWIGDFKSLPDDYVLNHQSLDGYLFLRYQKVIFFIFLFGCLLTWPILMPINATATPRPAGIEQFDTVSYSAAVNSPYRYFAHAIVAYIFFGVVLFVIARESLFYIHLRQAWLLSPQTASRMSSRTVCFTDVPEEYLNEYKLRSIFPFIRHVWLASDTSELEDQIDDRDKTATKLETAEIKLSKTANAQRMKLAKKKQSFDNPMQFADEKRPTHKLKPLFGQKVDTIDWSRGHLQTVIPEVERMQAKHWNGEAKPLSAVFIEFENIQAAEAAFQQLTFHKPKVMQPRAIGMRPDEVVWKNLNKKWWMRDIMYVLAIAFVCVLNIFWVPFTGFVGAISNLPYLISVAPFLSFINQVPPVILGVITGLLPSIILAILMALVPIVLRLIAGIIGCVTVGEIELHLQNWYFSFQVIQVFLVTTFSSGAASVGAQIANDPTSAVTLLAQNLPKASNFYNSYVMFAGIVAFGAIFLNIVGLALFLILKNLLKNTPRKRYDQYVSIAGLGWGSVYPKVEIFAIIALSYAIISPLVMGFTTLGLLLFYVANRYVLMYVLDTSNISTQGATYPKALNHLMVGVYISELCLIGLLAIETGSQPPAAGPLILMIILLVLTIFAHIATRNTLQPLIGSLPRDLLYASTHKQGVDTQLESGGYHQHELGQNGDSMDMNGAGKDMSRTHDTILSTSRNQPGIKGKILNLIHPSWLPQLAPHLAIPISDYPVDIRREAYLNPAITSPTPLLWIVHDDMGISAREKELSGKVIGTTDQGAFWNEKGKLQTIWEGETPERQDALIQHAPIHEEKILY